MQPKLIIHGGAGKSIKGKEAIEAVRQSLHTVVEQVYELLLNKSSAVDAVLRGCQLLEDDPRFNAGTGSVFAVRRANSHECGINGRKSATL